MPVFVGIGTARSSRKTACSPTSIPRTTATTSATDTISNIGIVVAGNNKEFPTKGVSDSTLTGRQWGFAPRIGVAWTPGFLHNVVVRAGFGMYYDRGEYFAELSQSAGGGIGGPFGVTVQQPFSVPFYSQPGDTFATPFGTTPPPAPPKNLSGVASLIPNISQLIDNTTPYCTANGISFCSPLIFAGYDPTNKLPYSENYTLNLQWQPRNDLVLALAFVGNHGVHEVIPVPFNQPNIATPSSPINGQIYSYGYTVPGVAAENVSTLVEGFGSGNTALRVPFIGFDPNSQYAKAAGQSNYDALQFNVTKRYSHGLTLSGSYTWSHSMDEESGEQLFYNGDNPENLRTGYGNSDFDRRHVFMIQYTYEFPKLAMLHGWADKIVNGWGTSGLISAESGQPYSVIDFSGGVASQFYGGGNDFITNPLVPIGGIGSTQGANPVLQGTLGVNPGSPVLNSAAFGIPLLAARTKRRPAVRPRQQSLRRLRNQLRPRQPQHLRQPVPVARRHGRLQEFQNQRALQSQIRRPGVQHLQSPQLRHAQQQRRVQPILRKSAAVHRAVPRGRPNQLRPSRRLRLRPIRQTRRHPAHHRKPPLPPNGPPPNLLARTKQKAARPKASPPKSQPPNLLNLPRLLRKAHLQPSIDLHSNVPRASRHFPLCPLRASRLRLANRANQLHRAIISLHQRHSASPARRHAVHIRQRRKVAPGDLLARKRAPPSALPRTPAVPPFAAGSRGSTAPRIGSGPPARTRV